jgi:hypothetical protein
MNNGEPVARSLIPPQPNLGPEPWSNTPSLDPVWPVVAAVFAIIAAWLAWRIGRRRRIRSPEGPVSPHALDESPRGRLVALSASAKTALATRFGSAWRAKTTEELAVEPSLAELLGPEMLRELIDFLDRIDRLKFAPHRANRAPQSLEEELAAWNPRVAGLIGKIGAGSRVNGRLDRQAPRAQAAPPPRPLTGSARSS